MLLPPYTIFSSFHNFYFQGLLDLDRASVYLAISVDSFSNCFSSLHSNLCVNFQDGHPLAKHSVGQLPVS